MTTVLNKDIVEQPNILYEFMNLWNGDDIKVNKLLRLKYSITNIPIISEDNNQVVLEIMGMLINNGFDYTYNYLQNVSSYNALYWNQEIFDIGRSDVEREIARYRSKDVGITGVGTCKFCSSKELVFSQKQTRSADEPPTVIARCVNCNRTWKQQ